MFDHRVSRDQSATDFVNKCRPDAYTWAPCAPPVCLI
jgi:hypothetical protein